MLSVTLLPSSVVQESGKQELSDSCTTEDESPCKTPGSEIYYSEADHQDDSTDNSIRDFISDENSHFLTSSFGSFHSESSALTLHYLHSLHSSFKKSLALNKPFHIAKELLMTERTYKKDLEIVNVWFREEVSREKNLPKDVLELLLSLIDGLYEIHCYLLRHLEEFVLVWEGKGRPTQTTRMTGIGEILEQNIGMTETYNKYINTLPMILEKLHHSYCCNEYFEQMYRCFEMQRICYLPLISFILRPVHRLIQYYLILKKIMKHYEQSHPDYGSCKETLLQLKQILSSQDLSIKYLENYANLMELQRDIVGINNLVKPDRFSDMLLYTVRVASPGLEFKVKKQVSLQDVVIEKTEPKYGANYCFILYTDAKTFLLAANSEEERNRWLIDIKEATQRKKKSTNLYHNTSESEDYLHKLCIPDSEQDHSQENSNIIKHQHSSNSLLHVCWHRNTSVNYEDCRHSLLNYFSGPLLRKFKNSSGWQRLWVVFAQFSLFFYKSYQDDFPLANLPVLHYNISIPTEKDDINRPYCFKLEYKRHVYYFCAESEHMLQRWIEVIGSATVQRELLNCICVDIEEDF